MYNPQLDTFIRVAEAGSFSKAAQESFITPTAVIKQMNLLESRLGLTLFHRSHQGLSLTRAGRSLLADARHIVQYSQESIARARVAERGEKRIIRVGVSLMTPSTPLTKLWPKVKERCPGMSLQVVTFENTPSAARGLANLGQDMDIVAGIFDDAFLKERGCLGLELSREPLWCAVPVDNELAKRDIVTFDDLHNHSLMLIRRGWNAEIDRVRDEILLHHPQIALVDFPQYRAEVFNRGANEDLALATLPLWANVHPMLKTVPTDWDCLVSYGLLHSSHPADHVREFLDAGLPCSRQSIDRQSRTDALMPMGITGITASGTSSSEAFFFVLLGKSPLPKPLEHRAALLSVGVIVGIFDLFRQIVGNQRLHSILVAILDRLLVVPAFELQHVQRAVHLRNLRLHVGLSLLEHGLALGICRWALRTPFHEQPDVLDLHPSLLQAFDDPKRLEFRIAESANAGRPLQPREQSLLIVITQRGNGQTEHLRHLSDCVHGPSGQISN